MKKLSSIFILLFGLLLPISEINILSAQDLERHTFHSNHMGARFTIILYADNEDLAKEASQAAFNRIEELNQLMSDYIDDSELNRLSRTSGSGEAMKVSPELFEVLSESVVISEMSGGLFDVTIGPYTKLWRAVRMEPEPKLPYNDEIRERGERVGYQHMVFDEENRTIKLNVQGMQLDLGGIAKGYASEEAIRILRQFGIRSALVDGGGDISLGKSPPGRAGWEVAIPLKVDEDETTHIMLSMSEKTVTTSGDMFQYIEIDGTRYSHILNPKTGLGTTEQIQATVIAKEGMYADALASVLTLMKPEEGVEFINGLKNVEAYIMMRDENGIKEWKSTGFDSYLK